MGQMDVTQAVVSDMTNSVDDYEVSPLSTQGISDAKETNYVNPIWAQNWGYFNAHPDLKSAILMKAVWDVGRGYTCDTRTKVILERIQGNGKETFNEILFNLDVGRKVGRDSFAEIVRDSKTGILLNLKPLDPSSIRIVYDDKGIILRYEQISKLGNKKIDYTFKPEDIFHLSNDRIADSIHGISVIESLEPTLLAELESFANVKKIMNRQAKPFIIFKWKTDDKPKIEEMKQKIDYLRNLGEDLHLPDDENILTWEVVQVNIGNVIFEWRNEVRNKFYRAIGLPLIIFGTSGSTESGGKMEYLAHQQVFEREQKYIEEQVLAQLGLRIDLISPISLLDNLQTDQSKDGIMQGMNMQQNDLIAGRGK